MKKLIISSILALSSALSFGATGYMGTGIPTFTQYGLATGATQVFVSSLASPTVNFPAGCTGLYVDSATLGADAYKIMVGTMLAAQLANRTVTFYAHTAQNGGCGITALWLN